jgi:uncharacterized membrane protein
MSVALSRNVLVGILIVVLHVPLISLVYLLHGTLSPGQGLADLGLIAILALLALTALPYAVLAMLEIDWNPERARLGEYDC